MDGSGGIASYIQACGRQPAGTLCPACRVSLHHSAGQLLYSALTSLESIGQLLHTTDVTGFGKCRSDGQRKGKQEHAQIRIEGLTEIKV